MGTVAFEIDGLAGVDNDLTGQYDRTIIIVVIVWLYRGYEENEWSEDASGEGI